MKYDVIVIGAGASGLMTAGLLCKKGLKCMIIERLSAPAKKILATGNGKCNYTNELLDASCYPMTDFKQVSQVLEQFDNEAIEYFFYECGVLSRHRDGYVYPMSEQAKTISECLIEQAKEAVTTLNERVEYIEATPSGYVVNGHLAKYVVIATGGKAYPKLGSDGSGYELARLLGHSINEPLPSLTSVRCKDKICKQLQGIRNKSCVTVIVDGKKCWSNTGEVQFTAYGLSGIPIFQLCSRIGKALRQKKQVMICVDLLPTISDIDLFSYIKKNIATYVNRSIEGFLSGLVNSKFASVILQRAAILPKTKLIDLTKKQINQLVDTLKKLSFNVDAVSDFEQAQVTCGGIPLEQIDLATMESKRAKGIYFTGEIIDVDGICGGYNLQWAWSSAYVAAKAISNQFTR